MPRIFNDITGLIGKTPLLELHNFRRKYSLQARLIAKLEYLNPIGSVKDRVAFNMIKEAEEQGLLRKESVIIEPTSGNTGIGLAAVAASKGYRVIITMPETMSRERQILIKAFGAEIVLTDGKTGMQGAIAKAEELSKEFPYAYIPGQFSNPANPAVHYTTTGPEIWEDTGGQIDVLVAGVGTGGTISGVGKYLREKNPGIFIAAVEPAGSPVLSQGAKYANPHGVQGIGAGFIPDTLNTHVYDEIITIQTGDAYESAKKIAKTEGLPVGISSGAALHAATELARKAEFKDKTIVTIFPDSGERYLSTDLYNLPLDWV
jgi:cysteine synthase A